MARRSYRQELVVWSLLPVVMATQGGDAGLAACDVVIEVDGERGLSAEDTKVRLRLAQG